MRPPPLDEAHHVASADQEPDDHDEVGKPRRAAEIQASDKSEGDDRQSDPSALPKSFSSQKAIHAAGDPHVFALVETKVGHRVRFVKFVPCDRYRIEIGGIAKHPLRRGAAAKARPRNGRPWVSNPASGW